MDSITQAALGACLGELTLGEKLGNRAPLLGALVGSLPDLDVFISPFLEPLEQIGFHRGYSHSLFFLAIFSFPLAAGLARLFASRELSFGRALSFCLTVLFSAVFLDCFTAYGTKVFLPFSDYSVALNSISVIDPLYTIPLLFSLILSWCFAPQSNRRRLLNSACLLISTTYLASTLLVRQHVLDKFEERLSTEASSIQRTFIKPSIFNNILWRLVAEVPDGYLVGYYSLFDQPGELRFKLIKHQHELLNPLKPSEALKRLKKQTHGYFIVEKVEDSLQLHDLRYGQIFEWANIPSSYIFSYEIKRQGKQVSARALPRAQQDRVTKEILATYLRRILSI